VTGGWLQGLSIKAYPVFHQSGTGRTRKGEMVTSTDEEVMGAEVELVSAGELPFYNPDNDFRKLALDTAYVSEGFRLVDKEELIGVPFIIKRIVYREGFPRDGAEGDYISVEAIIADKRTLEAPPVKSGLPDPLTVYGNEPVVFNDSGTGIRRTLTRFLDDANLIDVGQPVSEDANPFDKPFQAWHKGAGPAQAGFSGDDVGHAALYLCVRGLRRSDYEWHGQDATTYYIG
jgi:hypothetical protein